MLFYSILFNKQYNKSMKNKKDYRFINFLIAIAFIIIPYLTVWLLFGEINLLSFDWIWSKGDYFGEPINIDGNLYKTVRTYSFIDWKLLLIVLIYFLVVNFSIIILSWKKILRFDIIPFNLSLSLSFIALITTKAIDYSRKDYLIMVRILIVIVVLLTVFYFSNFITNKILIKLPERAYEYAGQIKEEIRDSNNKTFEKKNKDEDKYIEIKD